MTVAYTDRVVMSPGRIPDRPPRKRTQPRWPALLLIAGITLTVAGFVLTVGPFALDPGGTDSPSADGPTDDPAATDADVGTGDDVDGTDDTARNGDEAAGADGTEETETTGIPATINTLFSESDESADKDADEEQEQEQEQEQEPEKCVVD